MNKLIKFALNSTLAATLLAISPGSVMAQASGAYGDYERGVTCKKLRRSGELRWFSIASGTLVDGGGRDDYSVFVTKACHTNERSCRRWVKRVGHEIGNLDRLEVAYCKRAS